MIRQLVALLRASEVGYWTTKARIQFYLRGASWPRGLTVKGPLGLSCQGKLEIGADVSIVSLSKFNRTGVNHPTQIVVGAGAYLSIGAGSGFSGGSVYCMERIEIGRNVLVGINCRIWDSDFHPLEAVDRSSGKPANTAPVTIEDNVWLGADVIVLKGVRIGARSVVAARSVVTKDVPADSIAAGTPAKPIKSLLSKG
ncbi:MAG: acyltransferase [Gammaproteobacteria bacterium]|nr:acyltransferase [Gammaproteobacteria bacterium]